MALTSSPRMAGEHESDEAWSVSGVFLLTEGNDGRVAIPDLQLSLADAGITLAKASGEVAWHCGWPALDELSPAERSVLPDGRSGLVVIFIEHNGRRHRFVVPSESTDQMEESVRAQARRHGVHTQEPPSAVSRPLTVAVVVATVVTVTLLLLSAAHVLHF